MKKEHKGLTNLTSVKKKEIKKFLCFGLLGLAIIVLLVTYASSATKKTMTRCIFCDIVAGKSPSTKIEVETDEYVIFKDIKPASTHHYLCVTKKHIDSLKSMTKDDIPLINRMEEGLTQFYKSQGIDTNDALFGFHMPPFISVKHLHMHGIQPKSNMSWTSRIVFKPFTYWFKTVEEAKDYLDNKPLI